MVEGKFCIYEIVLNALATIVAVLIMYVHSQAECMDRPPDWLLMITFVKDQDRKRRKNTYLHEMPTDPSKTVMKRNYSLLQIFTATWCKCNHDQVDPNRTTAGEECE